MMNNMALALFKHEQINTTLIKAKNLRPFAEKIITLAKKGNLESRRKTLSILKNKKITDKVFKNIAKRYESRKGGYIRIIKNGFRYGDSAPQAIIELVDRDPKAKGLDSGPSQNKNKAEAENKNLDENKKIEATEDTNQEASKEMKENLEIVKKKINNYGKNIWT